MNEQLYHYTSADGVLGILENRKVKFMLSEVTHMNDETEGLDIYEHLEMACKQLQKENEITPSQRENIIQYTKNHSCYYPVSLGNQNANEIHLMFRRCRIFTISFSKDSDSLPMWNYYGNHGYCLHFTEKLLLRMSNPTFYPYYHYLDYGDVTYSNTQKIEKLRDIIFNNKDGEDYKEKISRAINHERFFFKRPAFEYEKEYRILIAIPDEKIDSDTKCLCPEIKYKNRSGRILPCLEIELDISQNDHLLTGVTIGPLTENQMARNALANFLVDRGYLYAAANLPRSKVPVRFL